MIANDVISQFSQHFRLVPADSTALLREVYRMRYEVYCREMEFERPEQFPDGLEYDAYDRRARHCLLQHRASSMYAGCVRLIIRDPVAPDEPFPFERYCGHSLNREILDPARLPAGSYGEISRLTVTARFRRRTGERGTDQGRPEGMGVIPEAERRVFSHIAVGLYLAGAALGLEEGLDGVFVMMEPRLARHLSLYDIRFTPVGEVIDYHGKRGPFYISRDDLLNHLSPPLAQLLGHIRSELAQPSEPSHPQQRIALTGS